MAGELNVPRMRPDLPYWLALLRCTDFGPARMKRLADGFPSMREAFLASVADLVAAGIEPHVAEKFVALRGTLEPEREAERLRETGMRAITRLDDDYPASLATIHDPPPVLFVRGALPAAEQPCVAVVGSRHATPYGQEAVRELVGPLARAGVSIVSGLAYGIDAHAHRAALDAGGHTVAVPGSGVDAASIYPVGNRALADRILAAGGAVLSEFPPGTPVFPANFPRRNRVIAGLARLTLVIEAAAGSGSLITARFALEHGRDVGAVPGPFHAPLSSGCHRLIREGALCVTAPEDIFDALSLAPPPVSSQPALPIYQPADPDEAAVLTLLHPREPLHVDDLVERAELPAARVSAVLSTLELAGAARAVGGLCYVRN